MPVIPARRGPSRPFHRFALTSRALLALAALALVVACRADAPTAAGTDSRVVAVTISAALTPAQQEAIAGMSVEVTGPALLETQIAELEVNGASVSGVLTVSVGLRHFAVRAYDATGAEIYFGTATTTVRAGTNPQLAIRIYGRTGSLPVAIRVGDNWSLMTSGATLAPGGGLWIPLGTTATMTLTVSDAAGNEVTEGVARWAVLNPVAFRVTTSGNGRVGHITALMAGASKVGVTLNGTAFSTPLLTRMPGQ